MNSTSALVVSFVFLSSWPNNNRNLKWKWSQMFNWMLYHDDKLCQHNLTCELWSVGFWTEDWFSRNRLGQSLSENKHNIWHCWWNDKINYLCFNWFYIWLIYGLWKSLNALVVHSNLSSTLLNLNTDKFIDSVFTTVARRAHLQHVLIYWWGWS